MTADNPAPQLLPRHRAQKSGNFNTQQAANLTIAPGDFLAGAGSWNAEGERFLQATRQVEKFGRQCCPINYQSLASSDRSRFYAQRFDVRWHVRCARRIVDPITARGQGDNVRSLLGIFQVQTGKGVEGSKMSIDYLLPPVRYQSTFMLPHADDSSHRIDNMLFAGYKLRLQAPGSRAQARTARRRARSDCRDNRKLPVEFARRFRRRCRLARQLRARRSAGWFFLPSRQLMLDVERRDAARIDYFGGNSFIR